MSLLLLFGYPNPLSVPISTLVETPPSASNGQVFQRPASEGEWRFVLELADPADGETALWRDATSYYAGDRYQRGGDDYLGRYRAAIATVQLQIDDSDMLAPWGQDTSSIFGVNVRLDAGLLMRLGYIRVVDGVVVEWEPDWTGRVEVWGDNTEARGQIRKHIVSVIDTISDLANVPTIIPANATNWDTWFTDLLLPAANWLFGVDIYGDTTSAGLPLDLDVQAAINRMDAGTDPLGLVWRSLRTGRMVIHPAPWDTTNTNRYINPLLDVYPDGLKFSYFPDVTDVEYIQDDGEQSFGVPRTVAGVLNSFLVTMPADEIYAIDDPVSAGHYGVRPFQATWILSNPPVVDDLMAARAYASAQALPLRTTLDHEGFWSAMVLLDQYDPVTVVHATRDDGMVLTATGVIRNVVEERTYRGDGLLSWQSTVQIDVDATETSPSLLPVENLALVATESPGLGGPSLAEFSWTNPVQPDITPTEVQLRVLGRSLVWFSEDYPGVGADGTVIGFLAAATTYTFQVRLIRRVSGVITAYSASRQITFTTPFNVLPVPIPGDDPTDTDVDMPPFEDCEDDVSIELQENDGTSSPYAAGWTTVDTFSGAEIEQDADGNWHLVDDIPNSFFNEGSMYRFLGFCGDELIVTGTPFDPPDDWTDPCTDPPSLLVDPYNRVSLLVYVPKVCAPDIIREAVSGLEAVHGDALEGVVAMVGDPNYRALMAIPEPGWSTTPGGILAYGECPQIVGFVADKETSIRANIANNDSCVLGECAAMRLTTAPGTGGDWIAGATIATVEGNISLLSGDLPTDTPAVIKATYQQSTGTAILYVDDVLVDTQTVGTAANTISALPIWRVGAPPESWVTDFAVWSAVNTPAAPLAYIANGAPNAGPFIGVKTEIPSTAEIGDILFFVTTIGAAAPVDLTGIGFTYLASSPTNIMHVYWRFKDGTEPPLGYDMASTPLNGQLAAYYSTIYAYRGADPVTPFDGVTPVAGPQTNAGVTTNTADALAVLFGGYPFNGGTGAVDNGFTDDFAWTFAAPAGYGTVAHKLKVAAGAVGATTFTGSHGSTETIMIALRQAT